MLALLMGNLCGNSLVRAQEAVIKNEALVVKLGPTDATVSGVYYYDFGSFSGEEVEVFIPVPVPAGTSGARVLDRLTFHVSLANGTTPKTSVHPAPREHEALARPAGVDLVWLTFRVPIHADKEQRVQISFKQPLIEDVFYYIPLMPQGESSGSDGRHALFVYSNRRPVRPVGDFDYDSFGAEAVAYLSDKKWVGFK